MVAYSQCLCMPLLRHHLARYFGKKRIRPILKDEFAWPKRQMHAEKLRGVIKLPEKTQYNRSSNMMVITTSMIVYRHGDGKSQSDELIAGWPRKLSGLESS